MSNQTNQISDKEKIVILELNKSFINGSSFNDFPHITNCMRKRIKEIRQIIKLEGFGPP